MLQVPSAASATAAAAGGTAGAACTAAGAAAAAAGACSSADQQMLPCWQLLSELPPAERAWLLADVAKGLLLLPAVDG
jgi:hypothetical protein